MLAFLQMTADAILSESLRLREARQPFALATVIDVRGSASAKPGSKAIISNSGINLLGWVGGGCAESFICQQALEALQEEKPRVVTADLDDEIFGLGMPCGGVMDVYIEPILPQITLHVRGHGELAKQVAWLGQMLDYRIFIEDSQAQSSHFPKADFLYSENQKAEGSDIVWNDGLPIPRTDSLTEIALLELAKAIAQARKLDMRPLVESRGVLEKPARMNLPHWVAKPELFITGHSRITEELARFAAVLKWPVTVNSANAKTEDYPSETQIIFKDHNHSPLPASENTFVLIASHHKGDSAWMQKALEAKAPYVGLVASHKRSGLVFQALLENGISESVLANVRAPAGFDIGCQNPAEIAFSVLSEMIFLNQTAHGEK